MFCFTHWNVFLDRSSGGVAERKAKAARTGILPEEVVEAEQEELNQAAMVVEGAVEKANFALNTRFISYCMSKTEEFDGRLKNLSRALDAIALWIQQFAKDASKWHVLKDKDARTKLKWSKVLKICLNVYDFGYLPLLMNVLV